MRIKLGRFELEPLTAMVVTRHGSLFLTCAMPSRWLIQAGGSEAEPGPVWDGGAFCQLSGLGRRRSLTELAVAEDGLESALSAAEEGLKQIQAAEDDRVFSIMDAIAVNRS